MMTLVNVEGRPPQPAQGLGKEPPVSMAAVTPDYFNAMGIRVKEGRGFSSSDPRGGAAVVVVNAAFARHYFPGESAIGKRIRDMTMEQRLASTMTSRRMNLILLGSFAAAALLLAAVGIYGVMSYAVTQRTRELGVRMALGAQKSDVLGIVVSHGLRLKLAGVSIGLVAAFALTRYLSSLLFSVKPTDPLTYLGVALALGAWRCSPVISRHCARPKSIRWKRSDMNDE